MARLDRYKRIHHTRNKKRPTIQDRVIFSTKASPRALLAPMMSLGRLVSYRPIRSNRRRSSRTIYADFKPLWHQDEQLKVFQGRMVAR